MVLLRCRFAAMAIVLLAGFCPAQEKNLSTTEGLYITVPQPLTSGAVDRIRNRVEAARNQAERRPSVVVFDFNADEKENSSTDFGTCYNLAEYLSQLHDLKTVAYVHGPVSGHIVLAALATNELVVGATGTIGDISLGNERLDGIRATSYSDLTGKAHPSHLAVVRKMHDASVQLRKGSKQGTDWYFDLRDRVAAEKQGVRVTDTAALSFAPDGAIGKLTAPALREVGLATRVVESRGELLELYGLSATSLRADPLGDRAPSAARYVLRGTLTAGVKEATLRVVRDFASLKGNILFLQLECSGGDLQAARELADELRKFQNASGESAVRIIAFIPDQAPDSAAIIALGCSEIVMSLRKDATESEKSEAEIGDFSTAFATGEMNADFWARSLKALAESQLYPSLLAEGFVKSDLEIVRVRKKDRSARRLMSGAEFEEDKARGAAAEWTLESRVKSKGQLLKLKASLAEELGLARFVVDDRDPASVYSKYGLEPAKVRDVSPAWLDGFADFLKLPAVTVMLVICGFTGLILELKVPGTTVPGIIASLCFILVFWAHTQFSGQVAVLAGLLFLLGLILILLEIFVFPGFGAPGIIGILFMLSALALATFGSTGGAIPHSTEEWTRFGVKLSQYIIAIAGSAVLAFMLAKYLPQMPYGNRLMLQPPSEKEDIAAGDHLPGAAQAASLLGAVGTALTVLRPAGSVRFGEEFVDVVTDGSYIPAGARVQVVEVEGTRIVVKEV